MAASYNTAVVLCLSVLISLCGSSLAATPLPPKCTKTYTTVKGDTCQKIVKKFPGITLSIFTSMNPGVNCKNNALLPIKKFVCVSPPVKKFSVTIPAILSSEALKPRPVSSLLTWQPIWAISEKDFGADKSLVPFHSCETDQQVITKVSLKFFQAARSAGIAVMTDGRTFRYSKRNCWTVSDLQTFQPFVSVATCSFPVGAKLFVPELHNLKMSNNMVHNGCVQVSVTCQDRSSAVLSQWVGSVLPEASNWREAGKRVHVREAPACVIQNYS